MRATVYVLSAAVLVGSIAAASYFILPGTTGDEKGVSSIDEALSIEERRSALLSLIDGREIPGPDQIRATARALFALPISEQGEKNLRGLAREANLYANMISRITDEYDQAFRREARYEFVQEEIQKKAGPILDVKSEFLGIRNQAYLNLGFLLKEEGRDLEAFFTFSDAHRLSPFDCFPAEDARTDCVRLIAEEEMKRLLQLSEFESYIYWGAHRN